METTLFYIAMITSTLMVVKLIMMLAGGMDSDADVGIDHGDLDAGGNAHASLGDDIQIISVFTVLVFLMMGSWSAWAATRGFHQDELVSLAAGGGVGFVSMYSTAWLMAKMKGLQQDGTLRNFEAKGLRGDVYMRIPPAGEGEGQVRLSVHGRLREFRAVNDSDEAIESFTPVEVLNMTRDQVLLVRRTG